jgi:hypothetical protein
MMSNATTATWAASVGNLRRNIAGASTSSPGSAQMDSTTATCTATLSLSKSWATLGIELLSVAPSVLPRIGLAAALALAWPALDWVAQEAPQIATLIAVVVPAPSVAFRRDPVPQDSAAWTAQAPGAVAPLTFVYGQQPPPLALPVGYWPTLDWPSQTGPESAAWNVPAAVAVQVPFRRDAVPWPTLDWAAVPGPGIVPFTLVYGQQPPTWAAPAIWWPALDWAWQGPGPTAAWNMPPVVSAFTSFGRAPVVGAVLDWTAQGPAPNAAWNVVAAVVSVPPPLRRDPVWTAVLDWLAQTGQRVAPLALVYGQQPPTLALPVAYWPPLDWPSWTAPPSAAWNVPVVVVSVVPVFRPPLAWVSLDWGAQAPGAVAPLTLPYGQLPPGRAPSSVPWPALDWSPQPLAPTAGWNLPPIVSVFVPGFRSPVFWVPLAWAAQEEAPVAPLTLIYGQAPPTRPPSTVPWPALDWLAQAGAANVGWKVSITLKTMAIAFIGTGNWTVTAPKPNYIGGSYMMKRIY